MPMLELNWLPPNRPRREWNKLIVDFANNDDVDEAFSSLVRIAVKSVGNAGDEASVPARADLVRRMLHEYIDSYIVEKFVETDLDLADEAQS